MSDWLSNLGPWLKTHPDLILPLLLSLGMAACDLKTRRIPNYLTLGGALGGLGFQFGYHGLPGLLDGLAGLGLGLLLLLGPYLLGGMGAGDVKASAALGAWLGLRHAAYLFVYMGLAGGLIIVAVLLWQRRLLAGIRELGNFLLNWVLCRQSGSQPPPSAPRQRTTIPYGAAKAAGMAVLCWRLA
ncbi:MAG: prepilin peptidase [Deltaproteobacteria bacterium]|nr:prepilin peptidase [Deltaproteobacteria bacterium]